MESYESIGGFEKKVSTTSVECQTWVNRGLAQLYGFNHIESVNCFKKALTYDSKCAFAHYGIIYSYGPHYNYMDYQNSDYDEILSHFNAAVELKDNASDWEKALIEVAKYRYPSIKPGKEKLRECLVEFSQHMKIVYEKFSEDQDIGCIYVESLMNLNPWQLWEKNGNPLPEAAEAKVVLDKIIAKGPHPLAYHLYIHLYELSPFAKDAVKISDGLLEIAGEVGHLLHMPSHIYIQVGQYLKSLNCNKKAIEADMNIFKRLGPFNFFSFYRFHNYHFLIWTAMFLGDYNTAIDYANKLKAELPEDVVAYDENNFEHFYNMYLHVYMRFGKWDEIINDKIETREKYYLCRVMQRIVRCVAYGVKGMIKEAEEELAKFLEIKNLKPEKTFGNNLCQSVFEVAEALARGELEYRKANYDVAYDYLRKSVVLCDGLIYDEPWNWPMPTRHALGALLAEQGHFEEAEFVYRKDLEIYPKNIWSLNGLYECLIKLGKSDDIEIIKKQLEEAKVQSNGEIKHSCFCRKK